MARKLERNLAGVTRLGALTGHAILVHPLWMAPIPPPALTEDEACELDDLALDGVTGGTQPAPGHGVQPPAPGLGAVEKGGTAAPKPPAALGGFEYGGLQPVKPVAK